MSAFPDILWSTVIRWLGLSALAGVIGGLVLDLLVLPQHVAELAGARMRFRRLTFSCFIALIAATAGELAIRAYTMSGGGLARAFRALPLVLTQTHFGALWITRVVALGIILLFVFRASTFQSRLFVFFLSAGVALTTSLVGHAADWGDLSVSAGVDWVHMMAAGAWTGGLAGLAIAVVGDRAPWPPSLFERVSRRFSRLAAICLITVVVTGSYNAWVQVRSLAALWTTPYGRVLLLKLVVVLGLVWLGAVNRYRLLPRLTPGSPPLGRGFQLFRLVGLAELPPGTTIQARLASNIVREVLLALVVLGCTALLGETTPGRHARHLRHPEALHHAEHELSPSASVEARDSASP